MERKVYQCLISIHKYDRYSGDYTQHSAVFSTYDEASEFYNMCKEDPVWVAKLLRSKYADMVGELVCEIKEIEVLDYKFISKAKDRIAQYKAEWSKFLSGIEKEGNE